MSSHITAIQHTHRRYYIIRCSNFSAMRYFELTVALLLLLLLLLLLSLLLLLFCFQLQSKSTDEEEEEEEVNQFDSMSSCYICCMYFNGIYEVLSPSLYHIPIAVKSFWALKLRRKWRLHTVLCFVIARVDLLLLCSSNLLRDYICSTMF